MSLAKRPWLVLVFFGLLILLTRLPLAPGQLFTFDDVNLSYAMGHYDIRISQPQPPGYPLFVLEMRILHWLRFKRAESILLFLAFSGSVAAMLLLLLFTGNRILGGDAGWWAAWVMLLHPVLWHAGVTSAPRVQLAVVSLVVAAACWGAWQGEAQWIKWSAVAVAVGAGIRPETGPLLFPLWAASALRARASWKERARGLGWMGAVVAMWLLPAMIASGGPIPFLQANLDYVSDHASVSSALFGASDRRWVTTFWRLLVWVYCGVLAWRMAALAFRRKDGFGIARNQVAFLALWLLPWLAFSLTVHVEDPGQTLAMVPVVCLIGGILVERAIQTMVAGVSRLLVPIAIAAAIVCDWICQKNQSLYTVQWLPLVSLGVGLALRILPVPARSFLPRAAAIAVVLAPVMVLNYTFYYIRGWYYKGAAVLGIKAVAERAWADINTGFALTSVQQIESTLGVDDHTLREARRLLAERRGQAVILWEEGLTSWRKAAYYVPDTRIAVLEHQKMRSGPPAVAWWRGPKLEQRLQGGAPLLLTVPAGARLVWLLNTNSAFYQEAQRSFPLTSAGPVWVTDLPSESGARVLGEYGVRW